jgi:hypothetical protein
VTLNSGIGLMMADVAACAAAVAVSFMMSTSVCNVIPLRCLCQGRLQFSSELVGRALFAATALGCGTDN